MRRTWFVLTGVLCLCFTAHRSARADHSRWPTGHTSVQAGTLVGVAELRGARAVAIGGRAALSHRIGPASVGAEYDLLGVGDYPNRGELRRVGLVGRLDLARFNRHFGGPNTSVVLWIDGGIGRQRGEWHTGEEIRRNDACVGAGWLLDHKSSPVVDRRRAHTVGWRFGWRMIAAQRPGTQPEQLALCRDRRCPPRPCQRCPADIGFVVSSSFTISW